MADIIDFLQNYNGKLNCDFFTTIRLRNDSKYHIGHEYYVSLKEKNRQINKGLYRIAAISHFKLEQLTVFMAYIDTGKPLDEAKRIIKNCYENRNPAIDWDKEELSFILLVKK